MRAIAGLVFILQACKGGDGASPDGASSSTDDQPTYSTTEDIVRAGCDQPMPTNPVLPIYENIKTDVDSGHLIYAMPEAPRGVLFAFHGSGGNVGQVDDTEWWRLFNLMHCDGVGVIIGEAEAKEWNTSDNPNNSDFARISALRDLVMAETGLEADMPVFAVGFSNGGQFTSAFVDLALDAGWDVRGAAFHNSSGLGAPPVPANYHTSENDTSADNNNIRSAQANHADQGLGGGLYAFDEIVVDPSYFTVLASHDDEQSAFVFDDLAATGLIATDGTRLIGVDEIDKRLKSWADMTEANGALRVTSQLKVAWATHRFSGAFAEADRDLFVDQLD